MALTNDPAPRRKPGRPRKVAQAEPELEIRADLEVERELEPEPAPELEYAIYRYIGPVIGWVVTADGTYEVRPNDELTLANAEHLESNPNFVRVAR